LNNKLFVWGLIALLIIPSLTLNVQAENGTFFERTQQLSDVVYYLIRDNTIGFNRMTVTFINETEFAGGMYSASRTYNCTFSNEEITLCKSFTEDVFLHEFGHYVNGPGTLQIPENISEYGWFVNNSCSAPMTYGGQDLTEVCRLSECFIEGGVNVRGEDFAEVFRFYLTHGLEFRELIDTYGTDSTIARKYYWMRDNIFGGKEFNSSSVLLCTLTGDYFPCDDVSLSEVVSLINLWVDDEASLREVVTLINRWASD
jgi:hypothetical protein